MTEVSGHIGAVLVLGSQFVSGPGPILRSFDLARQPAALALCANLFALEALSLDDGQGIETSIGCSYAVVLDVPVDTERRALKFVLQDVCPTACSFGDPSASPCQHSVLANWLLWKPNYRNPKLCDLTVNIRE
jgi:hypothetical protein